MNAPRCLSIVILICLLTCCLWAAPNPAVSNRSEMSGMSDSDGSAASAQYSEITIPGPLRSFLRMAGISQKIGRNVYTQGYEGSSRRTEFLILLTRYVAQARELTTLAGSTGVIHVSNCEDAGPLLRILGYRTRPDCGHPGTSLLTADSERAFLTIDSGFPLPELEQTLEGGKPFEYSFSGASVPILFAASDWTGASKKDPSENVPDLIDSLLRDPALARLYWAISKLDPETAAVLQRSAGVRKLLPYAAVLDFYGSHICIRDGRVVVPGGAAAEPAWKDVVGASPDAPGEFVEKLLAKDRAWLAAYFDVLSRVSSKRQAYFTEEHHLRHFYDSLRAPQPSANATTGSFRPAPALLLLVTRLQFDSAGQPLVPGNIEVWKEILRQKNDSPVVRQLGKRAARVTNPEQLAQTMFALARADTDVGPLQIYLTASELDSRRAPDHRLTPETVRLLARKFENFRDQYRTFTEFPELSDNSIVLFFDVAHNLESLPNPVRGNALGAFEANAGIWQILARQGEVPRTQLDESWQSFVSPFAKIRSAAQLYDAGRTSLSELFRVATGKARPSQDEIIELLAGPRQTTPEGERMHRELASRIRAVLDGQRLVSLDTLFTLGDGLTRKAQGKAAEPWLIHAAGELREFEMPRPIFTSSERTEWAAGIYNNRHTDLQMRTDVVKILTAPSPSHSQIEEARGQLASFLRDALVGLNYAYYEPPGAQALHANPLFVRSHDFAAETVGGIKTVWQAPELYGAGSPAGGGAHFVGSLADLPQSLADLEQDFIAPENVQALIWKELVPSLLASAVLPRWWDVSQDELHAVTLYQRTGEELLAASTHDDELQNKVMAILSDRVTPRRFTDIKRGLLAGHVDEVIAHMMPADTFYLAVEFQRKYPSDTGSWGDASRELQSLSRERPEQVSWKRLSQDFGVPHPTLAQTYARELLNLAPMPAFSGYSSRLLAESWDSTNLYWARLADEKGYSPVMLNHFVPELTRRMVEKIFATDFEDWPAILRAMRETGEDFRSGKLELPATASAARP
jgi:hypothetical protein